MKKFLLAFLLLASPAYAANVNISDLPAGTAAAADLVEIQQGGVNKQGTAGVIANTGALTGDVTKSAGSGVTTLAAGSASNLNSGTLPAGRMPALTGDCTTSAGAVATTCNAPHPGYIASNYYFPLGFSTTATGTATGANVIACMYGVIPRTITISNLFARVTTAGSSNTQFAIYTNSSGVPGALIAATASAANNSGNTNIGPALSANKQIGPGGADGGRDIWFCVNQNDSTVVYQAPTGAAGSSYLGNSALASVISSGPIFTVGKSCAGANCQGGSSTFGSWPASLATSTFTYAGGTVPAIGFQVVSSP